jgi:bifunctional non-homologous end joining protein LigD
MAQLELESLRPMLLASSSMPEDDSAWAFEIKYDGWRALTHVSHGRLRVISRLGNDLTARLPELAGLAERLRAHQLILDGEIIAPDASGRPSLEKLQERMQGESREQPICLMLFDVLQLDGKSLLRVPLGQRKELLAALALDGPAWRTAGFSVGNGAALLEASRAHGLEGLVAKRLDSRYQPGRRSPDWIKLKNFTTGRFVVGGWVTHGDGRRGLLVGTREGDKLRYMGTVEVGPGHEILAVLESIARKTSPFLPPRLTKEARFVAPRLVAEVQFLVGGEGLRDASLVGLEMAGPGSAP